MMNIFMRYAIFLLNLAMLMNATEKDVSEETSYKSGTEDAIEIIAVEDVTNEEITEDVIEEELPIPVVSITSNLISETAITVGTEMVLTLHVDGVEGYDYTIQWQQTKDGVIWTDLEGETSHELRITLQLSHAGVYWRAVVQVTGPSVK